MDVTTDMVATRPPAIRDGRLRELQGFVDNLTFTERLTVSEMISKKNDHITRLPPELLGKILTFLPPFHPWRTLSLVRRSWQDKFMADDVLRHSLHEYWQIHDPADTAGPASSEQTVKSKALHIKAMRSGIPFSNGDYFEEDMKGFKSRPLVLQATRSCTLKGNKVAWISRSHGQDGVRLRNIPTGAVYDTHGSARESITSIALSKKVLAFLTFAAKLYVLKLPHESSLLKEPKEIRLPSASSIPAFHADEYLVAVIQKIADGQYNVVLHDYEKGRSWDFAFASPGSLPYGVLVNAYKQHIDVFCSRSECEDMRFEHITIEHTRYALDGTAIGNSSWQSPPQPKVQRQDFMLGDLHSTGQKGHYFFRTNLLVYDHESKMDDRSYFLLCFDTHKAQFYHQLFPANYIIHSVLMWKDIKYAVNYGGCHNIEIHSDIFDAKGSCSTRRYPGQLPLDGLATAFVNDSFIVAFEPATELDVADSEIPCVRIFSFEEEVCLGSEK